MPGSHWRGLRLTHLEQEALELPERACRSTRPRVVAMVESGTGTVLDAAVGAGDPDGRLLGSAGRGTLLTVCGQPLRLADLDALSAARVALLWQLPDGHRTRPTPERLLPDGSYLTRLGGRPLRVLAPGIFSNLLDAQRAPAAELLGVLASTAATDGTLREAVLGVRGRRGRSPAGPSTASNRRSADGCWCTTHCGGRIGSAWCITCGRFGIQWSGIPRGGRTLIKQR